MDITFEKPLGATYTEPEVIHMCAKVRKATGSSNAVLLISQGDNVIAHGYTPGLNAKPVFVALNNLNPDVLAFQPIRACSDYELSAAEVSKLAEVGILKYSTVPKEPEHNDVGCARDSNEAKTVKVQWPGDWPTTGDEAEPTPLAEFYRKINKPEFEAVTLEEVTAYCIEVASLSTCVKRKVGAVIMHDDVCLEFVTSGYNWPGVDGTEDKDQVKHAEVKAIENLNAMLKEGSRKPKGTSGAWMRERMVMYITHEPCAGCIAAMKAAGIHKWVVVENFMKFDTGKLRFDLIPAIVYTALASIFTYGAKKYSPNNWKQCKDLGQYKAAVMRHWVAYINGERLDADSGKPHLWHVLTNVAFLIWFDDQESENNVN